MKTVKRLILLAAAAFGSVASGAWYDNPVVKATVDVGYPNNGAHYMNMSEDGAYLMLNLHSSNDAYPVQLYSTAELKAASGTVSNLKLGQVFATKLLGPGTYNWKGGAISSRLGLMLPGSGQNTTYATLAVPADSWAKDGNAFVTTGLADGGADGLDFNASGTKLYANRYASGSRNLLCVYSTANLKSTHTLALEKTVTTNCKRIRNLSVYSIAGRDLVYFGEGDVATGAKSVYVYDATENQVYALITDAARISADVMNVKVSGASTSTPKLYVQLDSGALYVYALAENGRSVKSSTPVKAFAARQVAALCGMSALPSAPKFRNFEVTDDGECAFFMHESANGVSAPGLCVVGAHTHSERIVSATPSRDANGRLKSVALTLKASERPFSVWVASGTKTCGNRAQDWERLDEVARIGVGETSCNWSANDLPAGTKAVRFFVCDCRSYEYLELTGSQSVLTDFRPTGLTRLETDMQMLTQSGSAALWGARQDGKVRTFTLVWTGSGYRADYNSMLSELRDISLSSRQKVTMCQAGFTVGGTPASFKTGDSTWGTTWSGVASSDFSCTCPLALGGVDTAGSVSLPAKVKFYSVRLFDDYRDLTAPVRDLVAGEMGGRLGLYDLENGGFYPASGTGAEHGADTTEWSGASRVLNVDGAVREPKVSSLTLANRHVQGTVSTTVASDGYVLVACWGVKDGGEDFRQWDHVEKLADLTAGSGEYAFDIALESDAELPVMRFLVLENPGEGIQTVSGISANADAMARTEFTPSVKAKAEVDYTPSDVTDAQFVFGSRNAAQQSAFELLTLASGAGIRADIGDVIPEYKFTLTKGNRYVISFDTDRVKVRTATGSVLIDRVYGSTPAFGSTVWPIAIFGINQAGTLLSSNRAKGTIHSLRVWADRDNADSLMLDLVPQVRNGTAGFFNRTDRTFISASEGTFGSAAATGGLDAGAEVVAVSEAIKSPSRCLEVTSFKRSDSGMMSVECTVTAGAEDCSLIACWGASDGGTDIADWAHSAILGTVAAASTSWSGTLPVQYSEDASHVRFFLVDRSVRVYESLLSTGREYVLTDDFAPSGKTRIEAQVQAVSGSAYYFWGARKGAYESTFGFLCSNGYRADYGSSLNNLSGVSLSSRQTVKMDSSGFYVAGKKATGGSWSSSTFTTPVPLMIYNINNNGTRIADNGAIRYWSFKAWSDGANDSTLALDLVPAMQSDTPGFLNLRNGRFYGETATGTTHLVAEGSEQVNPLALVHSSVPASVPKLRRGLALIIR